MVKNEGPLGTCKVETRLPKGSQMGREVSSFPTWSPR